MSAASGGTGGGAIKAAKIVNVETGKIDPSILNAVQAYYKKNQGKGSVMDQYRTGKALNLLKIIIDFNPETILEPSDRINLNVQFNKALELLGDKVIVSTSGGKDIVTVEPIKKETMPAQSGELKRNESVTQALQSSAGATTKELEERADKAVKTFQMFLESTRKAAKTQVPVYTREGKPVFDPRGAVATERGEVSKDIKAVVQQRSVLEEMQQQQRSRAKTQTEKGEASSPRERSESIIGSKPEELPSSREERRSSSLEFTHGGKSFQKAAREAGGRFGEVKATAKALGGALTGSAKSALTGAVEAVNLKASQAAQAAEKAKAAAKSKTAEFLPSGRRPSTASSKKLMEETAPLPLKLPPKKSEKIYEPPSEEAIKHGLNLKDFGELRDLDPDYFKPHEVSARYVELVTKEGLNKAEAIARLKSEITDHKKSFDIL